MISPNKKREQLTAELYYLQSLPQVDYFVNTEGIVSTPPNVRLIGEQKAA